MSFALNEDNALIIFEFINFVKLQNSFLPNLYIISNVKISYILLFLFLGNGGWGMGVWGLGIGPNPLSPIPNPQSPIQIFSIIFF